MTYSKRPRARATCSIEDCETHVKGYGLCDKHYQRAKKAGTLVIPPPKSSLTASLGSDLSVPCPKGLTLTTSAATAPAAIQTT